MRKRLVLAITGLLLASRATAEDTTPGTTPGVGSSQRSIESVLAACANPESQNCGGSSSFCRVQEKSFAIFCAKLLEEHAETVRGRCSPDAGFRDRFIMDPWPPIVATSTWSARDSGSPTGFSPNTFRSTLTLERGSLTESQILNYFVSNSEKVPRIESSVDHLPNQEVPAERTGLKRTWTFPGLEISGFVRTGVVMPYRMTITSGDYGLRCGLSVENSLEDFYKVLGPPDSTIVNPIVVDRYGTPMFQEKEGDVHYHTTREAELSGFVTERIYLRPNSTGSVELITFLYLYVH